MLVLQTKIPLLPISTSYLPFVPRPNVAFSTKSSSALLKWQPPRTFFNGMSTFTPRPETFWGQGLPLIQCPEIRAHTQYRFKKCGWILRCLGGWISWIKTEYLEIAKSLYHRVIRTSISKVENFFCQARICEVEGRTGLDPLKPKKINK